MRHARALLFCAGYGIGDMVMQLPLLRGLRRAAPRARLVVLGALPALQLLEGDPGVDDAVAIQGWGLGHWFDRGTRESRAALARWFTAERFDLLLNLSHANTAVREVLGEQPCTQLDTVDLRVAERALREGCSGMEALRQEAEEAWGVPLSREHPDLFLPPFRRTEAERLLDSISEQPLFGVSPVASSPLKAWPLERLTEWMSRVHQLLPSNFVVLVPPGDAAGQELLSRSRVPGRVVQSGHLQVILGVLRRCRAMACNDTGLMHMAAAAGVPTLGIFGPTSANIYRPPYPWAVSVGGDAACPRLFRDRLGPPGCWDHSRCPEREVGCVQDVSVEEAVEAFLSLPFIRRRTYSERPFESGRDQAQSERPEPA